MGETSKELFAEKDKLNKFMYALIRDIKAMDSMLERGMFEEGVQRIGAEQELCLVDKTWRPGLLNMEVLANTQNEHFVTEHSKYNLEINLDPLEFSNDCLSSMEKSILDMLKELTEIVHSLDAEVILVGILPTIRRADLKLENLTPLPRYHLLNEVLTKLRGGPYEFLIQGTDELYTKHNSIMFEGCNTSFQVHLQIHPDEFVDAYNWAQAITAPVMAVSTNSPLLLGKRLWHETRIALFQQSIDIRSNHYYDLREEKARVTFGNRWVKKSITEIFKADLVRYQLILGVDVEEDAIEALEKGQVPSLKALRVFNGTVYKWNRACYGITDGKPHLRIENRILPSGPTVADEMANAAFWLGLMNGRESAYPDITQHMDFDDAKTNFLKAARHGLETQFRWVNGRLVTPSELILQELLPIAHDGLKKAKIRKKDREHYLGIIEERVKRGQNGSIWMLSSFNKLRQKRANYEAAVAITAAIVKRQQTNEPVHTWQLASANEAGSWINRYPKTSNIMSTDLFTVFADDLICYASNIMNWKRIRYIPVENKQGDFVGLLTHSNLLTYHNMLPVDPMALVEQFMIANPLTISPEAETVDALTIMRDSRVGCLPVVKDGKLVGIVTETDFMNLSEHVVDRLVQESKQLNQ